LNEIELLPPKAPELDGWEARFIGSEPRLGEVADMYREIGFEVILSPFVSDNCDGCCTTCFGGPADQTMVVYTKKSN